MIRLERVLVQSHLRDTPGIPHLCALICSPAKPGTVMPHVRSRYTAMSLGLRTGDCTCTQQRTWKLKLCLEKPHCHAQGTAAADSALQGSFNMMSVLQCEVGTFVLHSWIGKLSSAAFNLFKPCMLHNQSKQRHTSDMESIHACNQGTCVHWPCSKCATSTPATHLAHSSIAASKLHSVLNQGAVQLHQGSLQLISPLHVCKDMILKQL